MHFDKLMDDIKQTDDIPTFIETVLPGEKLPVPYHVESQEKGIRTSAHAGENLFNHRFEAFDLSVGETG